MLPAGFAAAYCAGDARAERFLPARFRRESDWTPCAAPIAKGLVDEIAAQQTRWGTSPARDRMLEKLRHPDVRVVVTGQQLGLFLGPLYTIYKALSAVAWAERIEAATGQPVVPLFWLQTEDHDFPEIGTCRTMDGAGRLRTIHVESPECERTSIAHRTCGDDLAPALESLQDALATLPLGEATHELFASHWQPGSSWLEAFARVLARAFADEGLLLLNPRCEAVAQAAAPIHRRAIEESAAIGQVLQQRSEELREAGFKVQVKTRPECSLSFFHADSPAGPRYRLKPLDSAAFALAGGRTTVNANEVSAALSDEPLRFSTSALLRPIVQDSLLPTAAYVAGPGEIGYFAQLEPLYSRFELRMPMIIPRRHYTVVEPEARRALDHLDLDPATMSIEDLDGAARKHMTVDPDGLREELEAALEKALNRAARRVTGLGPSVDRSIERTRKTVRFAFGRLSQRVARAQSLGSDVDTQRLRTLENFLLPNRGRQERTVGVARYWGRFGADELNRALRAAPDPGPGLFAAVEPAPLPTGGRL